MARAVNDPAFMGYIGGVEIDGSTFRATSCSLTAKQAINHPDVIDGATDWTLYQLGGIEIDGDVALPVVGGGFGKQLLDYIHRDQGSGNLTKQAIIRVAYGLALTRSFTGCYCNTLEMRATAGERLDATANFWGTDFDEGGSGSKISGAPDVRRVLSWADIALSGNSISSCDVREFNFNVNNNLLRNYTFCPGKHNGYVPNNISAGKRQVSGTLGYQGAAPTETLADRNGQDTTPNGGDLIFAVQNEFTVTFHNVVYEFQTIEAQPGLITSTVNWYAHAPAGQDSIEFA